MKTTIVFVLFVAFVSFCSCSCITNDELSGFLRDEINLADFSTTYDLETNNFTHAINNVDFSVISLQDDCEPAYANILVTRDYPKGRVSTFSKGELNVEGVNWRWWDYPRWETTTHSEWVAPAQGRWFGEIVPGLKGDTYMVSHPASCFKTMIATGIMVALEQGKLSLGQNADVNVTAWTDGGSRFIWNGNLSTALHAMLEVSDNSASASCMNLLHSVGMLPDNLMILLNHDLGLKTLILNGTKAGGHWGGDYVERNRSSGYDTTGFFHMTSWDAVRLFWLLSTPELTDPKLLPSWTVGGKPVNINFMSATSKKYLLGILAKQAWHNCLSTTATCGRPLVVEGIPAEEPQKWVYKNGSVIFVDTEMSTDVFPCQKKSEVLFRHKTGWTDHFGSNVGIVTNHVGQKKRRYIIAIFGNVGERYTDLGLAKLSHDPCDDLHVCYTQKIPQIASAVDKFITSKNYS